MGEEEKTLTLAHIQCLKNYYSSKTRNKDKDVFKERIAELMPRINENKKFLDVYRAQFISCRVCHETGRSRGRPDEPKLAPGQQYTGRNICKACGGWGKSNIAKNVEQRIIQLQYQLDVGKGFLA